MNYFSKYGLLVFSFAFPFAFSQAFAMQQSVVDPSTLTRVDRIMREFDLIIKEPWYKPTTGFDIVGRLGRGSCANGLVYGAAATGAAVTGGVLGSIGYAIKNGKIGALASSLYSSGSWLISGVRSWPVLISACSAVSGVAFIEMLRFLYQRTAHGKCLMLRAKLGEVIRELRSLNAIYKFDFTSEHDAENCSRLLFANSSWPLQDLLIKLSCDVAKVNGIYKAVQELEVVGIQSEGMRRACVVLKDSTTILSQGLLSNVNWIRQSPTFKDQEVQYASYLKRLEDSIQQKEARDAVFGAGGGVSYRVNAVYGNK